MIRTLSLFAVSLFVLWGCSSDRTKSSVQSKIVNNPEFGTLQDQTPPPFEFNLIRDINVELPEDFILTDFDDLVTDTKGNFYFLDEQQFKLISVDKDGKFRWMTGKEGRGPGDFEEAETMITDGEHLYISNLDGARLDIYDFDGNFKQSHNLEQDISFSNFIGFTSSKKLVAISPIWDHWGVNISVLKIHEDSISIDHQFDVDQSKGLKTNRGMTSRSSVTVHENNVFTGSILDYSFEVYNLTGELQQRVTRNYDRIKRPGMASSGESSSMRMFGGVNAPYTISGEYRIMHAYWPTNVDDPDQFVKRGMTGAVPDVEYRHSMDIFTLDGELLFSFENEGNIPEMGYLEHIDNNNFIYTSSVDPEPVIHQYKLERITPNN